MLHIQQRRIPDDRFARLVEFDGDPNSVIAVQRFLSEHGYILLRRALDRAKVIAARHTLAWNLFHKPYEAFVFWLGW